MGKSTNTRPPLTIDEQVRDAVVLAARAHLRGDSQAARAALEEYRHLRHLSINQQIREHLLPYQQNLYCMPEPLFERVGVLLLQSYFGGGRTRGGG